MGSPILPTYLDAEMVSPDAQSDLGMLFCGQNQLQLPFDMQTCEQAPVYFSGWETDHSGGSEFFTEDTILAAGLSYTFQDDAPFIHSLGAGDNPSNTMHTVRSKQPSANAIALSPVSSPLGESSASRPDIKLRSASCKPKRTRRTPTGPKQEVRARECHNLVEKQYRTRLKAQFEALLAVLPIAQTLDHSDEATRGNPGQYLSRGQVLEAARERILKLERDLEEVASMRDELVRDLTGSLDYLHGSVDLRNRVRPPPSGDGAGLVETTCGR
ncbi:hypothetical protein CEP52_007155 [Fusarium oligoseptatum]|uniref:BHLH domain-containing protein n=1 Tax=Fusarium oligoseptatum TaxID=2604345 RepID=A0A428TP32_9HYPO|nr:hypothetical protein CEP52_007155 [Fusarium oligoseptatum]